MTELLFLSWRHLARAERLCLIVLLAALLLWLALPAIPQDQAYHGFADRRALLGVANAINVLSNLPLALAGVAGIIVLSSTARVPFSRATEASLWCVAIGLALTALGSAWYHLNPSDATLVWDRLPMTLVLIGVMCTALAQRIGENIARVSLSLLFELGVVSVVYWHFTGDLSFYVTLQFGGIAALVALLLIKRRASDPFPWWWLLGWYGVAKVFEAADAGVWRVTGGLVAGHALKHVAAAIALAALFLPLRAKGRGQ